MLLDSDLLSPPASASPRVPPRLTPLKGIGKPKREWKFQSLILKKLDLLPSHHLGTRLCKKRYKLSRSEEHTSELQSRPHLVCRLLLEKKKKNIENTSSVK